MAPSRLAGFAAAGGLLVGGGAARTVLTPMGTGGHRDGGRFRRALRRTVGWALVAVGVAAIPPPEPGWALVSGGLGVLSRDLPWAARLVDPVRRRLDRPGRPAATIAAGVASSVASGLGVWLVVLR